MTVYCYSFQLSGYACVFIDNPQLAQRSCVCSVSAARLLQTTRVFSRIYHSHRGRTPFSFKRGNVWEMWKEEKKLNFWHWLVHCCSQPITACHTWLQQTWWSMWVEGFSRGGEVWKMFPLWSCVSDCSFFLSCHACTHVITGCSLTEYQGSWGRKITETEVTVKTCLHCCRLYVIKNLPTFPWSMTRLFKNCRLTLQRTDKGSDHRLPCHMWCKQMKKKKKKKSAASHLAMPPQGCYRSSSLSSFMYHLSIPKWRLLWPCVRFPVRNKSF